MNVQAQQLIMATQEDKWKSEMRDGTRIHTKVQNTVYRNTKYSIDYTLQSHKSKRGKRCHMMIMIIIIINHTVQWFELL